MRGSIIKRGKTYSAVVDLPKDPVSGKRRRKWFSGFKTKKEAERELAFRITEIEKGTFAELSTSTITEYLQKWFEVHKVNLSPSTFRRYKGIIDYKLIPSLGSIKLKDIKPFHIQEFITKELSGGRKDNKKSVGKALDPATVSYECRVLHKALQQAVEWEIISRNPADSIQLPRVQREEVNIISESEVTKLLENIKALYIYVPVYLAIYTGMRLGEVLGLRWQDVDLENKIIKVNRSNCQVKVGEPLFKEPKTRKSKRTIDISDSVTCLLRQNKAEQEKWKLDAKEAWQDYDLVCCHKDGIPINPPNLSSYFKDVAKRLGLNVTFHGLRHTHASLLIKAQVPLKVISERLGHSTFAVTMDIYSHVLPGMQTEAANKLEELLKNS
ncbi:MAG: site-specific integrase [Dehalobacterium sp.]